jgi:hypothetical protein
MAAHELWPAIQSILRLSEQLLSKTGEDLATGKIDSFTIY